MRGCFKRALSIVVALSVCVSVFSGCGKKKNADIMGSLKDAPWYDSVSVLIDDSFDRNTYSYVESRVIGVVDDNIIAVFNNSKFQDPSSLDYDDELLLRYYDMKGNVTEEINLADKFAEYKV